MSEVFDSITKQIEIYEVSWQVDDSFIMPVEWYFL